MINLFIFLKFLYLSSIWLCVAEGSPNGRGRGRGGRGRPRARGVFYIRSICMIHS